jgi:septum formation protein
MQQYWMPSPHRLVLASASPRRRQILGLLGIPFDAFELDVDESALPHEAPDRLAHRLAIAKAQAGIARYPDVLVLGADTVVELDGRSLGKPATEVEAFDTLVRLRGRAHRVITGVALACYSESAGVIISARMATTEVWMRDYTDQEIRDYVATGDPFDKAGSYAIQHAGFRPVERIDGCFLNVVGLPLPSVCDLLAAAWPPARVEPAALALLCPACTDRDTLLS